MNYYTITPSEKLKPFVRFFWVFENEVNDKPYVYRSMADGCAELLFHYKGTFNSLENGKEQTGTKQPLSLIHSQSSIFKEFITKESFGIFGVYLYPFALPQLFSLPSSDFSNQTPDLKNIFHKEGKELEEKIMLATDNIQRVKILSAFLEDRLFNSKIRDPFVPASIKHVIHSNGITSVSALAEKYNFSTRQFERKFKEYSGFSPKLYLRIVRFESALKEYGSNNKSLTEIAYKCGYYDQSHFIHEFKLFSGYHPKEYFINSREDAELRIT
jgi:AraC-like DNA-binding protein